jgi:hypothetical protein
MPNLWMSQKCVEQAVNNTTPPGPTTFKVKTGVSTPIMTVSSRVVTMLEADYPVPNVLIPFEGPAITVGNLTVPTAGAYSLGIRTAVTATSPVPFRIQGVEALQLELSVDGVTFLPVPNAQWAGPSHGGDADDTTQGLVVHHSVATVDVFLPVGVSEITARVSVISNYPAISATYDAIVSVSLAYITLSEVAV